MLAGLGKARRSILAECCRRKSRRQGGLTLGSRHRSRRRRSRGHCSRTGTSTLDQRARHRRPRRRGMARRMADALGTSERKRPRGASGGGWVVFSGRFLTCEKIPNFPSPGKPAIEHMHRPLLVLANVYHQVPLVPSSRCLASSPVARGLGGPGLWRGAGGARVPECLAGHRRHRRPLPARRPLPQARATARGRVCGPIPGAGVRRAVTGGR